MAMCSQNPSAASRLLRPFAAGATIAAVTMLATIFVPQAWMRRPDAWGPGTVAAAELPSPYLAARESADRISSILAGDRGQESSAQPPEADLLTRARRASLALVGCPPSLEDIRWLESRPTSSAWEDWIERLLCDRRHADYLAERLSRVYVGVDNAPAIVFRRRRFTSWLADELFANRPYDALVRELITAEGIWTSSPAVNFLTATIEDDTQGRPNPVRLAGRTARAFLGVRLDCVECHDDQLGGTWTQADFHALAAFFSESSSTLTGIRDQQRPYEFKYLHVDHAERVEPRVPFAPDLDTGTDDHDSRRARLANWVTHSQNQAFSRAIANRMWALLLGRPLVEPLDDIPVENSASPALDALAEDFVRHGFDLRQLLRVIALSAPFRATADGSADEGSLPTNPGGPGDYAIRRLRPEQLAGAILQSSRLRTIASNSPVLVRLAYFGQRRDFVQAFGELGEDEFSPQANPQTLPQRLLMLNGELTSKWAQPDLVANVSTQIAEFIPDNRRALEAIYLVMLTRRPAAEEIAHFERCLTALDAKSRQTYFADIAWTLMNSTEFAHTR